MKYHSLSFLVITIGILFYLKRKRKKPNKVIVPLLCLALGIFVTLISYESFLDFNEDIRSEIIGMLIEIAVIYLLIEYSLEADKKAQNKSVYRHVLRNQIKTFLQKAEDRYLSLFDNPPPSCFESDSFLFVIDKHIKWELFTKNSGANNYNSIFRDSMVKETENLILLYQQIMPQILLEKLLVLQNELHRNLILEVSAKDLELMDNSRKEKQDISGTLITIRGQLVLMKKYITKLENIINVEREQEIKQIEKKIKRREKIADSKAKVKQWLIKPCNKNKDKNKAEGNDISADA